jgi:hypothetical protein
MFSAIARMIQGGPIDAAHDVSTLESGDCRAGLEEIKKISGLD